MSRSAKKVVRIIGVPAVALLTIGVGWVSMAEILRADAFVKFRGGDEPLGATEGIAISNFEFKIHEFDRLTSSATVDSASVTRDRSTITMTGVRNGHFWMEEDDDFFYEAERAVYRYYTRQLLADEGVHVWNDRMDLFADEFQYDKDTGTLTIQGEVTGTLDGGYLIASEVGYVTDGRILTAGEVSWTGKLQDPVQDERREWQIHGLHMEIVGDVGRYEEARATDGEIIVVADFVTHYREEDVLIATGNVRYWSVDVNLKCDEATVYRDERRVKLVGSVTMLIKAEDDEKLEETKILDVPRMDRDGTPTDPQAATDEQIEALRDTENIRKFPTKVVADQVEYWYKDGERRAVITGNPFARQDLASGWRFGWAHSALYDGEAETLTLLSSEGKQDAMLLLSIGDRFKATDITLSTNEDNERVTGNNFAATVFTDDDDGGA
ncbi:MAG: hypothetical protein IH944_06550 [Armatimonadetes bacterium]|nr:hypothetical protein [Armatimonadota bacterium]